MNAAVYFSEFFKSSYLLIAATLVFCYFSSEVLTVYTTYFNGSFSAKNIPGMLFFSVYSLLCLGMLPIIFNRWIRKESLKDIGMVWPKNTFVAILSIVIALVILVPFMLYFATRYDFQGYVMSGLSPFQFAVIMMILFPIYYLGEECLMRGFLFLGLWKRVGWHSFWITDIIFTLSHIGKPIPEILLCIPASIVFNCITLATRSIIPAVIVHSIAGITLCTIVTLHLHF